MRNISKINTFDYSFGTILDGRTFGNSSRIGFNSQEKDDEIKGDGNSLDFGSRIYDPRLGKWLSLDPETNRTPNISPYSYASNNPVFFIDNEGKTIKPTNEKAELALNNYISSFDVKDDKGNVKVTAATIFGIAERTAKGAYSSELNLSVKKFTKRAEKAGLTGAQLTNAISLYKVLSTPAVLEAGVLSPTKGNEKAEVPGRGDGYSINSEVDEYKQFILVSGGGVGSNPKIAHPSENITEKQIDNFLSKGDSFGAPKGEGFAVFSTKKDNDDFASKPEGLLIIKEGANIAEAINKLAEHSVSEQELDSQNAARKKGND